MDYRKKSSHSFSQCNDFILGFFFNFLCVTYRYMRSDDVEKQKQIYSPMTAEE